MLRWLFLLIPFAVLTAGCSNLPNVSLPGLPGSAASPSPTPTVRTAAQASTPSVSASPTLTLTVRPSGTITATPAITGTAGLTRTATALASATRTITGTAVPTRTATAAVTATPGVTRTAQAGTVVQGPGVPGSLADVNAIVSATVSYVLSNTNLTGFEVEYQNTVREFARTRVQRRGDPANTNYAIVRWNNGVWSVVAYGSSFPNARELGIPDQLVPGSPPVGTPAPPVATATRAP